jgi:hypothetical protein
MDGRFRIHIINIRDIKYSSSNSYLEIFPTIDARNHHNFMPYQFDFLYFNNISWFYHKKSFGNLRKKLKKESINLFHP